MEKGTIVVLNGVSSSGKSMLAKALTKWLPSFFPFSVTDYEGVIQQMEDRENGRQLPVAAEYFYYKQAAMFADKGVSIILDQIIHNEQTRQYYDEVLQHYSVVFVGVHCPVEELAARELMRGDRPLGLALTQLKFVHQQERYDVVVNTHTETLQQCCQRIVTYVNR